MTFYTKQVHNFRIMSQATLAHYFVTINITIVCLWEVHVKRRGKKQRNRVLALVLSAAVVLTGITVPGEKTYAAEDKIDLMPYIQKNGILAAEDGEGSNKPAAEILVSLPSDMDEKQELDALGVKQLVVDFKVNTLTAYAGEQTGCMAFGMSEAYSWKNGEWVNIAAGESATAKFDLASMDWSGYDRIGKLGLQFANLASGSTVSYEISDIYFTTDTSGNSGSGGKQDDPTTDINTDIEYNFAKLLQESLYLYDANMCGTDVTEKTGLSWRQNCHTEDQYASYNGQTVDVSGGYHDAGDHAKFALPQAYTASVLGMSYYQFKDAFTELGQTEHIQRILDHFAEYLEK